jgi:ABC-2 type transport system ATP-binding protein
MKQRLAIAQAIMEKPKVILLDEPTNGLDTDGVERIRTAILEEKERGAILFLASHNSEDIHMLSDEIYRIEKGVLTKEKKDETL